MRTLFGSKTKGIEVGNRVKDIKVMADTNHGQYYKFYIILSKTQKVLQANLSITTYDENIY